MTRNIFSPSQEQAPGAQPLSASSPYVAGLNPEMQTVEKLIAEIAPTDLPVLIVGESGTGKEIVAKHIHELSAYRELPFLKIICATYTSESVQARLERLKNESREREREFLGTLFFDEISELDSTCQRTLLHCIPDGSGISSDPSLHGRLVSCTTQELEVEVQSGRFRSDLFYRLNHVCLKIPPLRRRKEDIQPLIRLFLEKYSRAFHRQVMKLSDNTIQKLVDYSWPGNIRQLENVVKKIVALENEELAIADLGLRSADTPAVIREGISRSLKATSRAASQEAERQLILQILERTHWNRKRAAEALQISYKALLYKLKQIQLSDSQRL